MRTCAAIAIAAGVALAVALPGASSGAAVPAASGHRLDPAAFEPGSCIAFRATATPRHRTVFIDVGHGGPDPGGVGTTAAGASVGEAPLNLLVSLDARDILRAAGFRVVLSRTGAAQVARPQAGDLVGGVFSAPGDHRDLVARDLCADRAHADVVLGMYFDTGASAAVGGSLTLYDATRPYWRSSRRLAGLVQSDVLARLHARGWPVPDDGVHTDVGFGSFLTQADRDYGHLMLLGPAKAGYLATPTMAPAALIEPLFLTDPAEASIAVSARGQRAIARGLADAVEAYFGADAQQSATRRSAPA